MKTKVYIKHLAVNLFDTELNNARAWSKGGTNLFHCFNLVKKHYEICYYVSGKLTEKFIFDL